MKRSFLLAGCVAASLSLFACGDDSSSSPNNVDRDTIESSGSEDPDSSAGKSGDKSSSSAEKPESSSSEDSGNRAATLDDFEKNMVIKGLLKTEINLSVGAKNGVFTLWLPGETVDSAWVVAHSDFKKGVLEINSDNATYATTDEGGTIKSMLKLVTDGAKLSFIVNEDEKLLCVYNGDTLKVETAKVKVKTNVIANGDSLEGKRVSCKRGDTTDVYSFYKGAYVLRNVVKAGADSTLGTSWSTGYYDIQRNKLLLLTKYSPRSVKALVTTELGEDYSMTSLGGNKTECEAEGFKAGKVDASKLATEWDAVVGDVDWSMELKSDGTFKILANEGRKDIRNGDWALFGDVLVLRNRECLDADCITSIMGTVSDFDAKKGFSYVHTKSFPNDDKEHQELPFAWTAPIYE